MPTWTIEPSAGTPGLSAVGPLIVVVGFDGSPPARRALDRAAHLLQHRDDFLEVVYVTHLPTGAVLAPEALGEIQRGFDDQAGELAQEVRHHLLGRVGLWHFQCRDGVVPAQLMAVAGDLRDRYGDHADIVIVLAGVSGLADSPVLTTLQQRFFQKRLTTSAFVLVRCSRSVGRRVYYLYMASIVGKKQGGQDLLLPGRVGPGRRQAPHRLAALPGLGRGDRASVCRSRARASRTAPATWPSAMSPRCGRCSSASVWPRSSTRSSASGAPTPRRRSGPTSPWPSLNRVVDPVLEARLLGVVGDHRRRPAGQARPPRRSTTGASGTPWTPSRRAQLAEIERRIVARMVETFGLDCPGLVLDMTNFATYIDSANDRAPIAQRGHAKQKRTDLRLVGLGLVVSDRRRRPARQSHAYAGNRPDVTQFADVVAELWPASAPWPSLGGELTLVYDAGQDSEDNQSSWTRQPAALRRLAAALGSPRPAGRGQAPLPHRRRRRASPGSAPSRPRRSSSAPSAASWSPTRRTCTTSRSPGFDQTLAKARRQLSASCRPAWRGARRRKSKEAVEAEIAADPQAPLARPGHLDDPARRGARPSSASPWRTEPKAMAEPRRRALRQAHPVHRPTTTGPSPRWWPATAPNGASRPTSAR